MNNFMINQLMGVKVDTGRMVDLQLKPEMMETESRMTQTIRHTDPEKFIALVNNYLLMKYQLVSMKTYQRFVIWRFVRIYEAVVEMPFTLKVQWGPVQERTPPVPEDITYVHVD
jgi:hypothetical protein